MHHHIKKARFFANLMDNQWELFGIRFGLDPLIGLIPQGGNIITLIMSFYMIWIAKNMRVPIGKIFRMIFNVIIDFAIGIFPVVGQIADFAIKSNSKNLKILEQFESDSYVEEPLEVFE